jgi:hypothetical protein
VETSKIFLLESYISSYAATAFGSLVDAISAKDYDSANFIAQRIALIVENVAEYLSGELSFR